MDPFYRAFEDRHRGSRELIKSRLEVYLPFVAPLKTLYGTPEVLDLGCGRGEWLELLQQNGFRAKGVDLDEGMLLACRELNLDVCQADALDYMKGLAAESLSVISAFHLVEHILFEALRQLVDEAKRILKPGGLLILETPNSENLVVGTSSFYLDPTHQKPIPAQLLAFVVEYAGFTRVKTLYLQESVSLASTQRTKLVDVLDGVSPDYAVIAQKKATKKGYALFNKPFERSYGLRLNALAERYDQQAGEHAQWLKNEWNADKQRIEELSKSMGQLGTELASEQQKAANLATELNAVQEYSNQQQVHTQWLQNGWDAANQRIEELSKTTGRLESELASEQQKAANIVVELNAANESNNQQRAHTQWLQNECDTAKQRIEELSKSTWQLEAALAAGQQKAENLAVDLNTASEHNTQLQAHAQWLQNELDAVNAKVHELNHSSHHWWTVADGLNQERKTLYASRSWRITKPLRLLSLATKKIINGILAIPKGLWRAFKFPFKLLLAGLINFILERPKLRAKAKAKLRKHPRLEAHLRRFASLRGIVSEATVFTPSFDQNNSAVHTEKDNDLSHLTPRARRIYHDLKIAIEIQQKENG